MATPLTTFITWSEGTDAATAKPVFVFDDPKIAQALARLVARRLGVAEASLRPVPARGSEECDR
jgi:hypothetical protein